MLTQPWPATSSEKARGIPDRVIYNQYRHDRLLHHCDVLAINGPSYRLKDRLNLVT